MQINIASGDAVICAVQDNVSEQVKALSQKEKLERHIRVLKRHLTKFQVDEETRRDLEEEIKETEERLRCLVAEEGKA